MPFRPCLVTTFWSATRVTMGFIVAGAVIPSLLLPAVVQLNNGRMYVRGLPELECITTANATMHTARFSGPYATAESRCDGVDVTLEFPSPPRLWNWATGDEVREWMALPHRRAFVDRNTTTGYTDPYYLTPTWWIALIVSVTCLGISVTCILLGFHEGLPDKDDEQEDPPALKRRTVPNYTMLDPEKAAMGGGDPENPRGTGVLEVASVGRE